MLNILNNFLRNESGVTAFEYSLIISLIGLALITALNNLGNKLTSYFNKFVDVLM